MTTERTPTPAQAEAIEDIRADYGVYEWKFMGDTIELYDESRGEWRIQANGDFECVAVHPEHDFEGMPDTPADEHFGVRDWHFHDGDSPTDRLPPDGGVDDLGEVAPDDSHLLSVVMVISAVLVVVAPLALLADLFVVWLIAAVGLLVLISIPLWTIVRSRR